MKKTFLRFTHFNLLTIALCLMWSTGAFSQSKQWVGTWYTAPQLVETANMPPSPGMTNNSLRQVVRVSIGGDTLRVRFCNTFSNNAVTMKSVHVAVSTVDSAINSATSKQLTFSGSPQVTMNAKTIITSDPIAFALSPRMTLAITINYGQTSTTATGHPGSRTASYLLSGSATPTTSFAAAVRTEHWYNILGIDVRATSVAASVAVLGNSITDGRGTTTGLQNRWPDILSERLVKNAGTEQVGILNAGIGGNCLLKDCLGPSGVSRFQRDVLDQPGIKVAIIAEAVNDIGGVNSANASTTMFNSLVSAYTKMINDAHAKNIKVYAATIMPFKGNGYYNQYSEQCRNNINNWIRTSGKFDAVIDFDKVMGSAGDPAKLPSSYQNDGLHPDATGYKKMGESIDLNLFKGLGTPIATGIADESQNNDASSLSQNFPNPFTDVTTIPFEINSASFVSLKVYSALGLEIAELAGKEYSSGKHTLVFDAQGLSKGIHFYTIKTNTYSATRTMILQAK